METGLQAFLPASLLSGTEVKRIDIRVYSLCLGDILSPYLKLCQKYSAQNVPEGFNGTDHPACPAKALHPPLAIFVVQALQTVVHTRGRGFV